MSPVVQLSAVGSAWPRKRKRGTGQPALSPARGNPVPSGGDRRPALHPLVGPDIDDDVIVVIVKSGPLPPPVLPDTCLDERDGSQTSARVLGPPVGQRPGIEADDGESVRQIAGTPGCRTAGATASALTDPPSPETKLDTDVRRRRSRVRCRVRRERRSRLLDRPRRAVIGSLAGTELPAGLSACRASCGGAF